MAFRPDERAAPANRSESESTLPPIQIPFTLRAGVEAPLDPGTSRSWGHQLGLWWSDVEAPGSGVVVTGIKPGGPASRGNTLRVGDVIVELNGETIRHLGEVARQLATAGPGPVRFGVRSPGDAGSRTVEVASPGAPTPVADAVGGGSRVRAARVSTTSLQESLKRYVECILCNPLQAEVTHEGVAADPMFGCSGADLDFANESMSISALQNAIVRNEPRLAGVTVTRQDVEVRERGEVRVYPGIRVEAQLAATGDDVGIELLVQDLARIRGANQMRRVVAVERER